MCGAQEETGERKGGEKGQIETWECDELRKNDLSVEGQIREGGRRCLDSEV